MQARIPPEFGAAPTSQDAAVAVSPSMTRVYARFPAFSVPHTALSPSGLWRVGNARSAPCISKLHQKRTGRGAARSCHLFGRSRPWRCQLADAASREEGCTKEERSFEEGRHDSSKQSFGSGTTTPASTRTTSSAKIRQ